MPVYDITIDADSVLVIGDCEISIDSVLGKRQLRLGFKAPKDLSIKRKEILNVTDRAACAKAEQRIKSKCLHRHTETLSLKGRK